MPATCGHDIDVPDMKVNFEYCVSPFSPVSDFSSVYDARMSIPGATISGCLCAYVCVYQRSG